MQEILKETENMLARGRMDLPLTLCFAVSRGDTLLVDQLLQRGLDPNEADSKGRTALHIAAASGSEGCVLLLLDHGANPNCKDSEGSTPLWEAIRNRHNNVVELLASQGASLALDNVGEYACAATEQSSLDILCDLHRLGGDINLPKHSGTTALHIAVCDGNVEIVNFLLQQGANPDRPDINGWTPREYADQQGHHDIKVLFNSAYNGDTAAFTDFTSKPPPLVPGTIQSDPSIVSARMGSLVSLPGTRQRRQVSSLHNSLFGIMSAAAGTTEVGSLQDNSIFRRSIRVGMSCPESGNIGKKLVLVPGTREELLKMGRRKFGFSAAVRVLIGEGAEIDDIGVIRDGDHLVLVSKDFSGEDLQSFHML